jgi:hypothetical protein
LEIAKIETEYYDVIESFINSKHNKIVIYKNDKTLEIINDINFNFSESGENYIIIHDGLYLDNNKIIFKLDNTVQVKLCIDAFIKKLKDDGNLHLIEKIEKLLLLGDY